LQRRERRLVVKFPIVSKREIDAERVWGLLITAFEGGIGYWAQIYDYQEPPGEPFRGDPEHLYRYADYPLSEGGAVILSDMEGSEEQWSLDLTTIRSGLEKLCEHEPRRVEEIMSEDYDAETADVFVQHCIFGEIVYG